MKLSRVGMVSPLLSPGFERLENSNNRTNNPNAAKTKTIPFSTVNFSNTRWMSISLVYSMLSVYERYQ